MTDPHLSFGEQVNRQQLRPGLMKDQAIELTGILRLRIETRKWPPGHIFSYLQVAEEFSLTVNHMPYVIFPAVRTLREEGLLESRPRVGIRVVIEGESWSPPDENSGLPHDVYIEAVLRARLHRKIYKPGELFPQLHVLAEEFGVSIATVRKSVRALQGQGILEVQNVRFRFVSHRIIEIPVKELLQLSARRTPGRQKLEAFGETRTLAEWAQDPRCKVNGNVLYNRYNLGWDLEKAIKTPKIIQNTRPRSPSLTELPSPTP
ncbi:GntR family transcriptional regulator [Streptomyces sp. NPDC026672]|uniref:GntR family transcriptional regulator n=1 Tax=unclassified Streptomyces TaxID=2593676 RepID=UPI0033E8E2D2